jgi:hypothetical protein
MGIKLLWDNQEKTILRHIYDGKWTPDGYRAAMEESRQMLLSVNHPVDLILDMSEGDPPPFGILPAYQEADEFIPDNQRLVVMVKPGTIMTALNRIIADIAPRVSANRIVVDSIEEARALIDECQSQANV